MAVQADVLDVILRVIGLRTFQGQMGAARASVADLGKTATKSDAAMAGLGSSSDRAGKRMAALRKVGVGVAAALVVTGAEAYKLNVEFEKQMTLVQTQAGARAEDMGMLKKQVLSMAHVLPQGPIELAKGLYHMQSVFQDSTKAVHGLRVAAQGAATGNSDLESTTSALAAAMRTGIEGTGSFEQAMGILNATVGSGNMRMDDLALAMGTMVVPAAKLAGLNLYDVGGALAVLTDEGQRADNAATHLRMAFTLMGSSSKIAQKNLATIGINATDLGKKLHGPNGLVEGLQLVKTNLEAKFPTFSEQLSGVTNEHDALNLAKRFNVISRAFGGARSSATIMLLLNQLDMLQTKINHVYIRAGNEADAWAATQKTASNRIHTAWSGLQADLIQLGMRIAGPTTDALVGLISIASGFVNFLTMASHHGTLLLNVIVPLTAAFIAYKVALVAGAIAQKGMAMLEFIRLLYAAAVATDVLTASATAMSIAIDANPISLIALAIAALIGLLVLAVMHWRDIKNAAVDAFNWIVRHWKTIAMVLGGPFAIAAIYISNHIHSIANRIRDLLHLAERAGKGIKNALLSDTPLGWLNAGAKALGAPHFAAGVQGFGGGMALINDGPQGESVWLPSGSSVQPSPASSLRAPRAHTPNPTPAPSAGGYEPIIHNIVNLDGKKIYESVDKAKQDKRARQ